MSRLADFFLRKKQDYRAVFSGRGGEAVLRDLLRECQMDRNPAVPGDAITTGVNIGRQMIGRFIQNNLHLSDGEIIRRANMIDEEKVNAIEDETDPSYL